MSSDRISRDFFFKSPIALFLTENTGNRNQRPGNGVPRLFRPGSVWITRRFGTDLRADKKEFIFIIDEWDCVYRIAKERQAIQKTYLDFLRGL